MTHHLTGRNWSIEGTVCRKYRKTHAEQLGGNNVRNRPTAFLIHQVHHLQPNEQADACQEQAHLIDHKRRAWDIGRDDAAADCQPQVDK